MELRRPPVRPNLRWIWPCPECFTIANAVYDAIGIRFTRLPITPENVLEALTLPLSPRDCVIIMMEGGFRRDRRSDSSALECGRLNLWVIGLLRNGILFMGLDLRSCALRGFRPKASSPDRLSRAAMEVVCC
jgi:hypothetical protein